MEIVRKIDGYLEDFFRKEKHKALLLTGVRQCGKTYAIRKFCKKHFKNVIEINFINKPEMISIFNNAIDYKDILLRLSIATNVKLEKGNTVIFFDEVQACSDIVTAIKFLVDEGSYSYILSGSLLGVELTDLRSAPVGYLAIKEMYPMDFEEFIIANGVNDEIINKLKNNFESKTPVDDFIHNKIMQLYRLYLIVGGMPAAVNSYIETNNLKNVLEIQQEIIALYKIDISQYDKKNKLYIKEIFSLIPSELNSKNKRFIFKNLNENLRFERYKNSFIWLRDAGVALPVYKVEEPCYPLKLSQSRSLFKLFSSDIGLLASQYTDGFQLQILNNEININFGSIYENAVAQELKAHGFNELYYFNSKRQGELDFVIEYKEKILPIEVKSGKDYERHNAINNILTSPNYNIKEGLVLCNDNIKTENKITYMPIYMTMFIEKQQIEDMIYKVDLTGLN